MALQVTNLIGFMGRRGRVAFNITKTDAAADGSDLTTYSFTGMDFGAADSTRRIIVAYSGRGVGVRNISSVTIGGVSATSVCSIRNSNSGNSTLNGIYIADVPTGTSGTVDVAFTGGLVACAITVYRSVGSSTAAYSTDTVPGLNPVAYSLDVPAGHYCIAVSYSNSSSVSGATWTGLTEDTELIGTTDFGEATRSHSSAHDFFSTAQTPLAPECNWASASLVAGAAASFGP